MAEITKEHIKRSYELGKSVYLGEMDRDSASTELKNIGMETASAGMYINALQKMLSGKAFKRTISYKASEYYIKNIKTDFDKETFENALSSLEQHIDYVGTPKLQEKTLIAKYRIEGKMITAQNFNDFIGKLETKFNVMAHTGRYVEFWSDKSRSSSRFVIGYDHLALAFQNMIDNLDSLEPYKNYVEKIWRDMSQKQKGNAVFQSLLTTQTMNMFTLLSKFIFWANDIDIKSYKDNETYLDTDKLKKAIEHLIILNTEGHGSAPSQLTTIATGEGINLIVYGAPGAGKSYYIENMTKNSEAIRTVFHPEYQHSDFVGGLRPSVDGGGDISYSFVPGPFINALLKAHKNPDKHICLIIEEINRANAAAVFGDVFQLLDRDNNGNSEYGTTPEEALKSYLTKHGYTSDRMTIPGNLSILATMNNSDQGVFSLDTAFKRRWQFHYCPIDFIQHANKNSFSGTIVPYGNNLYSWTNFAEAINNELKKKGIEEDRLIGTYFLADKERINSDICKKAISGKLLIYLWDDVLRHGLRNEIFARGYTTFSDLVKAYSDNQVIFSEKIEANLKPHAQSNDTEDQLIAEAV